MHWLIWFDLIWFVSEYGDLEVSKAPLWCPWKKMSVGAIQTFKLSNFKLNFEVWYEWVINKVLWLQMQGWRIQ